MSWNQKCSLSHYLPCVMFWIIQLPLITLLCKKNISKCRKLLLKIQRNNYLRMTNVGSSKPIEIHQSFIQKSLAVSRWIRVNFIITKNSTSNNLYEPFLADHFHLRGHPEDLKKPNYFCIKNESNCFNSSHSFWRNQF